MAPHGPLPPPGLPPALHPAGGLVFLTGPSSSGKASVAHQLLALWPTAVYLALDQGHRAASLPSPVPVPGISTLRKYTQQTNNRGGCHFTCAGFLQVLPGSSCNLTLQQPSYGSNTAHACMPQTAEGGHICRFPHPVSVEIILYFSQSFLLLHCGNDLYLRNFHLIHIFLVVYFFEIFSLLLNKTPPMTTPHGSSSLFILTTHNIATIPLATLAHTHTSVVLCCDRN